MHQGDLGVRSSSCEPPNFVNLGLGFSEASRLRYNNSVMKLPQEQVEWVAGLAYIALTDAEKSKYAEELSAVLGYVEELQQVDTNKVDETMQITGLSNVMDGDFVEPSEIKREEFLQRAPASERGYIKVKSVFNSRRANPK